MLMKLRATRPFRYNTRQLVAGEEFEAPPRDVRLLLAIKKATAVRAPADVPPPPPAVAEKIASAVAGDEALKAARAEYEAVVGRKPFHGWSIEALREKIAEKAGQ